MKTIGKGMEIMLLVAATALVALALGGVGAARADMDTPRICGDRDAVLRTLDGKYAEKPASVGLANNGTVVEVLTSEDGTWTIVMTAPNGRSCLLAAGEYWQTLPAKMAGRTL